MAALSAFIFTQNSFVSDRQYVGSFIDKDEALFSLGPTLFIDCAESAYLASLVGWLILV